MPEPDFFSSAIVVAFNLMTVAFALTWFIGQKVSSAVRHAQRFLLLQALAWILVLIATSYESPLWNGLFTWLAISASMAAIWQLCKALQGWLGPRNRWLTLALQAVCLLCLLGAGLLLESKPMRLAWFSVCYGLAAQILAWLALYPRQPRSKAWRYLLFFACQATAWSLWIGCYITLTALQEDVSAFNETLALIAPFLSTFQLIAILMAWREEFRGNQAPAQAEDTLTGLPLRHAILDQARPMIGRARREQLPLGVILIDMDHFARVNERHGSQMGDRALQLMGRTLQKQMRGDEIAGRWHGETFCLIVHADKAGVQALCTRLKSAMQIGAQYELQIDLDFSAGCALAAALWEDLQLDQLLEPAAAALQKAKARGPGSIVFEQISAPPGAKAYPPAVPRARQQAKQ